MPAMQITSAIIQQQLYVVVWPSGNGSARQHLLYVQLYTVFQKKNWTTKLMAVTLSNLNQFSNFFHY